MSLWGDNELAHHREAAPLGVLAEGPELGLGVLAAVLGRHARVETGPKVLVGS
jgi:hypothetical protein